MRRIQQLLPACRQDHVESAPILVLTASQSGCQEVVDRAYRLIGTRVLEHRGHMVRTNPGRQLSVRGEDAFEAQKKGLRSPRLDAMQRHQDHREEAMAIINTAQVESSIVGLAITMVAARARHAIAALASPVSVLCAGLASPPRPSSLGAAATRLEGVA